LRISRTCGRPAGSSRVRLRSFITDVFCRRILGWKVSTDKKEHLVLDALRMALATRRRTNSRFTGTGLIHHSDAGSQYTAIAMTEELTKGGIAGSIGSVGDALDNALMESTIGLYKTELIDMLATGLNWSGRTEVERETAEYIR
jgi:transposase InsO family protein